MLQGLMVLILQLWSLYKQLYQPTGSCAIPGPSEQPGVTEISADENICIVSDMMVKLSRQK